MFHVIVYQPEIPPNTGNIIRLCANTGATLHLVHPLGFTLDEKRLRRAGLDYREWVEVREHSDYAACMTALRNPKVYAFTTKASQSYAAPTYRRGDALLFGPETRGLPGDLLESLPAEQRVRIPMVAGSRSLNLSNAVALAVYEAWRQCGFELGS